jgi:predicted MPP superfamily phosphohydrolase
VKKSLLIASPHSSTMARMVVALFTSHKRAILLVLILACAAFLIAHGAFFALVALVLLLMLTASQLFWIARILDLGERLIPGKPRRSSLAVIAGLVYLFVVIYSYPEWAIGGHTVRAADYRLQSVLIHAAFWWWVVGSLMAFQLILAFGILDRAIRAAAWMYRRTRHVARPGAAREGTALPDPFSPGRRRVLERAVMAISATPFVAAGYGLLYERLDVEIVRTRARLVRLPKAFDGFRIALLSDIHLSPFAPAEYIRHCVAMTNELKPDLVALTGDYVAWDPTAQVEVTRVLSGLQAPHGVFGCMGNHEDYTGIKDSITQLFADHGIRMLRQQRAPIRLGADAINLIGMEYGEDNAQEDLNRIEHQRIIDQLKALIMPDTVNILLVHYPVLFGHPELPFDLTLAGDIHGGGQLSLDSIHRGFNLARLIGVPYARGWQQKGSQQLYMNRGIGTTGYPIRLGARPEITLFELTRDG